MVSLPDGAWGIFLGNLWGLLWIVGFVFYMNQFQIKPEERALEAAFGPAYINYKSKVRRWL
jgi:protein-S-isoprenylcysteine O-methyltransferase Ste14